jgi:hypothetical protein
LRKPAFVGADIEYAIVGGIEVALVHHRTPRAEPVLELELVAGVGEVSCLLVLPAPPTELVVVHDGVVTRVLDKVDFHEWLENPKPSTKWGYEGIDVTGHVLIGAIVDGWNYQRTPIYSFDLY